MHKLRNSNVTPGRRYAKINTRPSCRFCGNHNFREYFEADRLWGWTSLGSTSTTSSTNTKYKQKYFSNNYEKQNPKQTVCYLLLNKITKHEHKFVWDLPRPAECMNACVYNKATSPKQVVRVVAKPAKQYKVVVQRDCHHRPDIERNITLQYAKHKQQVTLSWLRKEPFKVVIHGSTWRKDRFHKGPSQSQGIHCKAPNPRHGLCSLGIY